MSPCSTTLCPVCFFLYQVRAGKIQRFDLLLERLDQRTIYTWIIEGHYKEFKKDHSPLDNEGIYSDEEDIDDDEMITFDKALQVMQISFSSRF